MLGLGWPQWLTIIALVAALVLTFKVMARASIAYDKARDRSARRARVPQDAGIERPEVREAPGKEDQ